VFDGEDRISCPVTKPGETSSDRSRAVGRVHSISVTRENSGMTLDGCRRIIAT
jgi:hypothetical protein